MKKIKIVLITCLVLFINGCNSFSFFDKDNTPAPCPLVAMTPKIRVINLWQTETGCGTGSKYLKLSPAITDRIIFTANYNGEVSAVDKTSGRLYWSKDTGVSISGGIAAVDNLALVGSEDGEIVALQQCDGRIAWHACTTSEILANPAGGFGVGLVKSIDGRLSAYSLRDGHLIWRTEQTEPVLILRGSSSPKVKGNTVIAGFANGNLLSLDLNHGFEHWQNRIALPEGSFAIQRMIDIDADPVIVNNRVYAATYQGKVSALDLYSGRLLWSHDISSYSGIAADFNQVYVSDATSHVWAFDANNGCVVWRQTQLQYRNITGPVTMGEFVVVGDQQGYLHWLSKRDGHFVARVRVADSSILATPVVDICQRLYVVTKNGLLAAYQIG